MAFNSRKEQGERVPLLRQIVPPDFAVVVDHSMLVFTTVLVLSVLVLSVLVLSVLVLSVLLPSLVLPVLVPFWPPPVPYNAALVPQHIVRPQNQHPVPYQSYMKKKCGCKK